MSTKNTILKAYDGRFKDIFQEIFEKWAGFISVFGMLFIYTLPQCVFYEHVWLCNYEISALRCCHSGDMWNYTFLPKYFQWQILMRLFCFPWAETTSQSLTSWRSGTSTGSSMTWWLRCWSLRVPLCGPARTMMEMYNLTSLLRVKILGKYFFSIISVFSIILSCCTHVHPISFRF